MPKKIPGDNIEEVRKYGRNLFLIRKDLKTPCFFKGCDSAIISPHDRTEGQINYDFVRHVRNIHEKRGDNIVKATVTVKPVQQKQQPWLKYGVVALKPIVPMESRAVKLLPLPPLGSVNTTATTTTGVIPHIFELPPPPPPPKQVPPVQELIVDVDEFVEEEEEDPKKVEMRKLMSKILHRQQKLAADITKLNCMLNQ